MIASEHEMVEHVLYGTQSDLREGVDQGFQFTLLATLKLCLRITSSCEDDTPKVHAMDVLPIVYLFESVL